MDWEETIYLNLVVHQLEYTITIAVYSRTSRKDVQVLRRYSKKVYATPSRRKMDSKGDYEEMTYPNICFTVDNFDEAFGDVVVRDGESVGIELTATNPTTTTTTTTVLATQQQGQGCSPGPWTTTELVNTVLYSASVPYEALKRVYDSRASQTVRKKLSQTNLFSLFSGHRGQGGPGGGRMEYVRLLGPTGKGRTGHSEMAVSKTKEEDLPMPPTSSWSSFYGGGGGGGGPRTGSETPLSEPGADLWDLLDDPEDPDLTALYPVTYAANPSSGGAPAPTPPPRNPAEVNNIIGFRKTHQRRLSDPSSAINGFMRLGLLERPGKGSSVGGSRATSMGEGLDELGDASCEILVGDILDEFEEAAYNPLWTMRGHTQIFHHWRESKRMQCLPLGAFVTYVMLPWWSIVQDVLDHQKRPVLTF